MRFLLAVAQQERGVLMVTVAWFLLLTGGSCILYDMLSTCFFIIADCFDSDND
jgi:hypothetical protein